MPELGGERKMTNCAECRDLEKQLEQVALKHLKMASAHGDENEATRAAKRKADQIQERFNIHKAKHGVTFSAVG